MLNQVVSTSSQLDLALPTWGGRRRGAGRKPAPGRKGLVPRVRRPLHNPRHPVHVTMRAGVAPDLRAYTPFRAIIGCLRRLATRDSLRVIHFSVQRDHLHLIVEAPPGSELSRGVQGLASGVARAVNRAVGRRGRLWRDRYHRHDLTSPRQMRNTIRYVLMNFRKHRPEDALDTLHTLDSRSSAAWFDGWDPRDGPAVIGFRAKLPADLRVAPTSEAGTWLGTRGWRRLGALRVAEGPARVR
jgi:putative transposase